MPSRIEGTEVGYSPPMYRGRAASKLTDKAPKKPWGEYNNCPYEDLESPSRVHIDALGYVHICQGLCIGNAWKLSFSKIINSYDPHSQPVVHILVQDGPATLIKEFDLNHKQA